MTDIQISTASQRLSWGFNTATFAFFPPPTQEHGLEQRGSREMVSAHPPAAAPVPLELPALGPGAYFDETQWQVLLSLVDAVVPSIVAADADAAGAGEKHELRIPEPLYRASYAGAEQLMQHPPPPDAFRAYLAARALENRGFVEQIRRSVANLPAPARNQLGGVLKLLAYVCKPRGGGGPRLTPPTVVAA